MLGYQSCQEKLLLFVLEEKQKQEQQKPSEKVGEKWIHEWIGMLIKGREKGSQRRDWENSVWFVDREGNVGNWWKNLMIRIRMIKSKGWITNMEIETIKIKIDNEGKDEVEGS